MTIVNGTVTLVGAGPGDAGLLTRRGLAALQQADVIVADRLGARAVLDQLAAEGVVISAEVIDVGKLPGHHQVPQHEINALLVRHARAGREVVRLKGGDPFVLGRGREEALYCEAEGIAVRVVPGVTSAISVPAVAGIPLTHRGVATGFTVASAHDPIEQLPGGSDHTVVLLMGVGTLAHTTGILSRGARGQDCPVAIIEDGYGSGERVTIGTLGTIAALAASRRVRNPAVVVVGDVVRLSSSPLSGSLSENGAPATTALSGSLSEDRAPATTALSGSLSEDRAPATTALSGSLSEDGAPATTALSGSLSEDGAPATTETKRRIPASSPETAFRLAPPSSGLAQRPQGANPSGLAQRPQGSAPRLRTTSRSDRKTPQP